MYNNDKIAKRTIAKDQFDFVQQGDKIYDQKIEGKPISYMQDVWMRFRKNKANLTASVILLILVVFSIIMPTLSGKEFKKLDEKLAYLPPRVPILENYGIMDGTVYIEDMPVDIDSYDAERDVYLPDGFNKKAVVLDSVTNETVTSAEMSPAVAHGQALMKLDNRSNSLTVESEDFMNLVFANNGTLSIDVYELPADAKLEVLLQIDFAGEPTVVAEITEPGVHQVSVFENNEDIYFDVASKLRLRFTSESSGASAAITSVSVMDDSSEEPIVFDEGYKLASYKIVDGKGAYLRQNGELTTASFTYNKYIEAFDVTHEIAFSSVEYEALLEAYGDSVQKIANPDNPDGWYFSEGFPIREVVKKNDVVVVDGESYSSYEVYLDYALYKGYDKLPYFLFGTTQAGKDLFSLVWVGLRTSLFLGLVVTLVNVSVGIVYGAISGFYGGRTDLLMQRFAELMGRIPWLVILAIMVVLFGPGIRTLFLTLIMTGWIAMASVTRMQFYRYKGREYVLAARTMGAKDSRLIFRHILPNGIGTIITSSVLSIPSVIFTEAALSYLGYGIGHGTSFDVFGFHFSGISIGVLLADGRNFLFNYPYLTIYPAIIVSILMIAFNMFGNALRDAFNPSLRGVEE